MIKVPAIYEFENDEAVYVHLFCSNECAKRWNGQNKSCTIEESEITDGSLVCELCHKRLIKHFGQPDLEKIAEGYHKAYFAGKIYDIVLQFEGWEIKHGINSVARVITLEEAVNWLITY